MFGKCWVCGKRKWKQQKHHVIPQRLKPLKNMTVPLCKDCHKRVHEFDEIKNMGREKVIFTLGKSRDGKTEKLMGKTYDGCIVFPDKKEKIEIMPNKEYLCTVFKFGKSAFARDIEEIKE